MTAGKHVKKVFARNRLRGRGRESVKRQGRGEGMKKLLVLLAVMLAAVAATAPTALASDVCPDLDSGKINTSGDPLSVTVTAPAGFLIDGYCVKAGSSNQGDGPVMVVVDPPQATVTISYPGGKAVSHYSYSLVAVTTTTTTTTTDTGGPTTDTGGPTTDTGGPTTDTGGPTTDTGGPTTTTTGGATTGTGGVLGGTTGGTTGGTASTGGELPFTGLPVWIPLLAAAALLVSGIFLVRRKKGELA
jgi:hypothetical protein